jgi:ABC-type phosphate transport system substrate-binding protein
MIKRTLYMLLLLAFANLAFIGPLSTLQAEEYLVVLNPANPVSSMNKAQIADMFLKKTKKWDNGWNVMPVDQKTESAVRDNFSKDVIGRSARQCTNAWQQKLFSGQGVPPMRKNSDADVLDYVKANQGAIGYVSASAPVADVKAVTVVK